MQRAAPMRGPYFMRYLPLAAFLGLSFLWGSEWLVTAWSPAQPRVSWLAIQYAVCALLLLPAAVKRRIWRRSGSVLLKTIIAGLGVLCVPQMLLFMGGSRLPQTAALIALALTPVFLAVSGRLAIPTSICGFAGLLFLSNASLNFSTSQWLWLSLPLASAGAIAWSLNTLENQLQKISVPEALFISALFSGIALSVHSHFLEHASIAWGTRSALGLIISSIVPTTCGYLFFYWLVGKAGAGCVSMLQWTQSLVAAAEWALLMRLTPGWMAIAGAILIVGAVWATFSNRNETEGVLFEITQAS
jgi:drug/metabolite transporter (DMT)-like permease